MRLTTRGLKARDHDLELGPLTLVVSPNGSGKSSLAEALRFLALGYVPALGKRPADTAALLRDREMAVKLVLDDGRTITRTLEGTDSGFRTRVECSWLGNAKSQEHAAAVLRLFGQEELDVAESLDIRELLAATPNRRAARIEALLAAGRQSPAEEAGAVARLTVQRLGGLDDERMPDDYREALPLVGEVKRAILKQLGPMLVAKLREVSTPGAMGWVNEEKRRATLEARRRTEARRELAARLGDGSGEGDPTRLGTLEKARAQIEQKIGAAGERWEAALQKRAATETARTRLEQARREFAAAQAARAAFAEEVAALPCQPEARVAEIDAEIAALKPPQVEQSADADGLAQRATELEREASGIGIPEAPTASVAAAESQLTQLREKQEEAKRSPWDRVRVISGKLSGLAQTRAKGSAAIRALASELATLADEHCVDPTVIAREIAAVKKEYQNRREVLDRELEAAEGAVARQEALRHEAARLRSAAEELRAEARRRFQDDFAKYNQRLETLTAERELLTVRAQRLARRERETAGAMEAAKAAVGAAEERLLGLGEAPAANSVEVEDDPRPQLTRRLAEIDAELSALRAAQARHEELRRIIAELERYEAEREVFAALEWALQRVREIEIQAASAPLVEPMARFLAAGGRPERPYFRAGDGVCEIGWRQADGHEVPVQVLSGGEYALFAAALTAAVIALRHAPLRVLLVEAGECDDGVLQSLLAGIEAASDSVTCALVMVQRPPRTASDSWAVRRLGARGHEARRQQLVDEADGIVVH